jgi:hypothetical protein
VDSPSIRRGKERCSRSRRKALRNPPSVISKPSSRSSWRMATRETPARRAVSISGRTSRKTAVPERPTLPEASDRSRLAAKAVSTAGLNGLQKGFRANLLRHSRSHVVSYDSLPLLQAKTLPGASARASRRCSRRSRSSWFPGRRQGRTWDAPLPEHTCSFALDRRIRRRHGRLGPPRRRVRRRAARACARTARTRRRPRRRPGDTSYGTTKPGESVTEADAKSQGYTPITARPAVGPSSRRRSTERIALRRWRG